MDLFDFTFNSFAILSLFAVVVNVVLIYLITTRGFQVSANRWFTLVLVTLVVWGVTETMGRSSANPMATDFWASLGMIGWIFVAPIFLGFTLSYVGRDDFLSSNFKQILLFGPALIFLFLGWNTNLVVDHNLDLYEKTYYGWTNPVAPFFWLALLYIDGLLVASVILLFRFWQKLKDAINRRQTLIVIIAVLFPIVGGSITNGLLPILKIVVFPAAVLLTSVMSLLITYAILRYKLFAINPSTVIENIVKTINEVLIVFNTNHKIEFVNDAVERVLGYKKEDLVGQQFQTLLKTDWEKFHESALSRVHKGETVSGVEVDLISAKGEKIPVNFSASPLKDSKGNIFGIVGVATDIRRIRELFTNVTAEKNKLITTIESIIDGVLALDFDGKVTMINPAALQMLGMKEADIINKNIDEILTIYDEEDVVTANKLLPKDKITEDTVIVQKKDLRIVTKFGKQIFANLTSSAIKEGQEVGLGSIITLNDVSKEKELEEMKLDFVSMAAHELRTPLTAIRGYLSVLQEETSKSLDKEQRSFLDKAFISSSQLAALVENLLSVSKIERGAMRLEVEETDWKHLLQESFNSYVPLVKEKGIKFVNNCPDNIPMVTVDKFRISEVLSNLLANAINYTKPGGKVELSAEKSGDTVITYVKDTGQGIPESAISKLFTKFFRVSGVLEQGSKGTGLGLYIAKAIIDMHEGKIWVKSKLGLGTTVSFSVPLVAGINKEQPQRIRKKRTFVRDNKRLNQPMA